MSGTAASHPNTSPGGLPAGGDAAQVQRIAEREEAAFRTAIAEHSPMLHRIAYRMVGEAQEAEDIVQEAMLRLWDHAPRLAAGGRGGGGGRDGGAGGIRLGAWLKRVTVNLAIDRLRVSKRIAGGEVPERVDEAPLADRQIEQREAAGTARMLMAALPDRQRAAIVLTYYEELPNSDAAAAMDMNIKAFESLLHRARGALRKAYDAHEGRAP